MIISKKYESRARNDIDVIQTTYQFSVSMLESSNGSRTEVLGFHLRLCIYSEGRDYERN